MAKTTVYVVNGTEEVTSIKEVAKLLGKKVTKKGIEAGDYPEVTLLDADAQLDIEHKDEFASKEASDEEQAILDDPSTEVQDEDTPALTDTQEDDTPQDTTEDSSEDDIEYPEVGAFDTDKAMKKYIKGLTDQQLQDWCELEGVEWKHNDHESINRMRMAMAIKALHFPDTAPKKGKKSKSKYSDYTTEQLVQMALDEDIEVPDDKGDQRILRMYTIMALRKAGIIE
jgi:hypothetical protein